MQKLLTPSIYGQESQKRKLADLLSLKVLPVPLNKVVDKRKLGISITEIKVLLQRYMYINSVALRMARTLWSFGHSECSRVMGCH